jgi:hypothetical protein
MREDGDALARERIVCLCAIDERSRPTSGWALRDMLDRIEPVVTGFAPAK